MRKCVITVLLFLCALVIVIINCTKHNAEVRVLRVGAISSLSGGAAFYGEECYKGAQIALERISEENKINVNFIIQDDKSDRTEAVKLAERLINFNKIDVLWGPIISPSAVSVGKICDEFNIPMVTPSATQDEVTQGSDYTRKFVTRVCFMDKYQGKALADYLFNSLNMNTAVIIFDKTISYSVGLASSFRRKFIQLGGTIIAEESYAVTDVDFNSLVAKVARYNAGALFIPGWDENIGPMLRQAGMRWDKFTLLGGDGWLSQKLIELSAGNIRNAFALAHYVIGNFEENDIRNEQAIEFYQAFMNRFGQPPSPHAALGYDAMMLIYKSALETKQPFDRVAFNNTIRSMRDVSLITGKMSVTDTGDVVKDGYIISINGDQFKLAQKIKMN